MSRSLKKGPFVDPKVMAKVFKAKADGDRKPIKTWSRACTITPEMVGVRFAVHNGKNFIEVFADENMVGHRLGEFSPTRTFRGHGGKLAKAVEGAKGAAAPTAAPGKPAGAKK